VAHRLAAAQLARIGCWRRGPRNPSWTIGVVVLLWMRPGSISQIRYGKADAIINAREDLIAFLDSTGLQLVARDENDPDHVDLGGFTQTARSGLLLDFTMKLVELRLSYLDYAMDLYGMACSYLANAEVIAGVYFSSEILRTGSHDVRNPDGTMLLGKQHSVRFDTGDWLGFGLSIQPMYHAGTFDDDEDEDDGNLEV
jgi:hypothetical protein